MANIFQPPAGADSASMGAVDPTLVSVQDPGSIAGIQLSYSTGAGTGSPAPGGQGQGADAVNQPNQYPAAEPVSGVALTGGTGMPGSQGNPDRVADPGQTIMVSDPNYTSGKPGGGSGIQMVPAQISLGPDDSTTVAGQYPPAQPILPGNFSPGSTGAGQGRVLRGGYRNGAR
jgi:hypothetical protein